MSVRTLFLVATLTIASALAFSPSAHAAGVSRDPKLQTQVQQLQSFASSHGVTMKDLKISQATVFGAQSSAQAVEPSCTATATISIPGKTGVALSATASTCSKTLGMLQDAIERYLRMLPGAQ